MSATHHEHQFIYDHKTDTWKPKPKEVSSTALAKWPIHLESMAVDPDQIEEAREWDRANGLAIDYDSEGRPIMTGPQQYKQYQKLHGVHQRNAYN